MEAEIRSTIEQIMKLIAAEFGPKCEVVLHDWSKPYDKSIVAIENGHVSGRHVGDGGSNLGLEVMRGTSDGSNQLNYITQTQDGRLLRSSSLYIDDTEGKKIGALCINYDVTEMVEMQRRIGQMTLFPVYNPNESQETRELFTKNVGELLDFLLNESKRIVGKEPVNMTKDEKKQAIHYLDKKGALLITKAGPKICEFLGISKYTLYAYLEELHVQEKNLQKQKPEE